MTGDQRKPDAPASGGVDAEWEASSKQSPEKPAPSPSAAAAKPAGAVLPAGTSSETTLLGIAPPPSAPQVAKRDKPRVEPLAEAAEKTSAPAASQAAKTSEPPKSAPKSSEAPKSAEAPKSSGAPQSTGAPKSGRSPAGAPDSVTASSSDRAQRVRESAPPQANRSLMIAAFAVLAAGALWFVLRSQQSGDATGTPEISAPAAAEPAAPPNTAPALPVPSPVATPAAAPTVGQSARGAAAAHETVGEAPAAANSDQGAAGSAGAEGVKVVVIKVRPASATFYYKGKKVGTSPLRVELRPGEKRAFEVGHPNYNTRKVVADGTEPEISVGLFPKSGGATTPPKAPAPD